MKVLAMLELGKECGLQTVSEAYSNVNLHCSSLFIYDKMEEEFEELHKEAKELGLLVPVEVHDGHYWTFLDKSIDDALEVLKR